ncbi:MAG: hypothetical protein J5779_03500, partial [Clostridia bacterium]|nr:hypothetical protein [Clostridia bacterium]
MSKKRAIIYICTISLITAVALIFSFISFNIAGKNYKSFVGFANAINPGLDYNGGIYAEYKLEKPEDMTAADFSSKENETFERINSVLESKGILDANVIKSDGKIRIEAANVGDVEDVLESIGAGELKIRTSNSSTADVILSGKNVTSAFATQVQTGSSQYQWGVYVYFDNAGKIALSNATKNAASSSVTLYMFRGESESAFFQLSISSQVTDGVIGFGTSENNAKNQAMQFYCGSLPITPVLIGNDVYTISAGFGNGALLGTTIALGALILASLIFFAVRYRELGLMACISFLLFVGLSLFFFQAIPVVELSLSAFAGMILTWVLIVSSHVVVFEKIRKEYALGKKIPASIKFGFKKSYMSVVDFSVI